MINNFWVDMRREKQLAQYGDQIAKKNKITITEFKGLPRIQRIEMLEIFIESQKKVKK